MKEHISPEEKLLEIIRKGNDGLANKKISGSKRFLLSGRYFKKIIGSISLKRWMPGIIVSLFVFSLVLLVLSIFFAFLPPAKQLRAADGQAAGFEPAGNEAQLPAVETYIDQIRKKDIFNSASFMKDNKSDFGLDGLKNIALLGIINEEPKQAIIKDKTADQVYYLKEGEILGEFKVSQILDGKIVVEYREEKFEIYL
jgi:hypothetical protein